MRDLDLADLRLHKSWTGTHKGVNIEVANWTMKDGGVTADKDCWNYYIILPVEQIPADFKEQLILKPATKELGGREWTSCDYMDSELINALDWHGGCTFYELNYDVSGKLFSVKMGCDYMHYWDEGHSYGLLTVLHDAKHSADMLLEKVPLLIRCSWNGKYYKESEGTLNKWGNFVANENREHMAGSFE